MHIERLKYIFEVSKTGSISIASQNLHVSQPAISQAISNVEEELGIKIFSRERKGTNLTFEGKKIIYTIKEILDNFQNLQEQANGLRGEISGSLNVATIPGHMSIVLKTFSRFKKEHPNVFLNIVEKGSKDIVEGVIKQKYDLGLIQFRDHFLEDIKKVPSEVIFNSPIHLCVSKYSHLSLKESVTLEDLKYENFVLYNEDFIRSLSEYLKELPPLKVLFNTENLEIIRASIIEDLAITFGTSFSLKSEATVIAGQTVSLPLIDVQPSTIPIGWVRSKNSVSSVMYDKFLKYLTAEYESYIKNL